MISSQERENARIDLIVGSVLTLAFLILLVVLSMREDTPSGLPVGVAVLLFLCARFAAKKLMYLRNGPKEEA